MSAPGRAVVMSGRRFDALLRELHARGGEYRESGAFLLGKPGARPLFGALEVTDVVYYDDVDTASLTGGITMHASGLSRLNMYCRDHRLRVLADVHTHPGDQVRQSGIDASHPMIALPGHIALIVPRFAAGRIHPHELGGHRLRAGGGWDGFTGHDTDQVFRVRPGLVLAAARLLTPLTTSRETA